MPSIEDQIAAQATLLKSLRASNSDVLSILMGAQKLLQLKVLLQKSETDPRFDKDRAATLMDRIDSIETTLNDEDGRLTNLETTLDSPAKKEKKAQAKNELARLRCVPCFYVIQSMHNSFLTLCVRMQSRAGE